MGKYKTYPEKVKIQIAKTGNINLYPELNIPRSTALYWIENANKLSVNDLKIKTKRNITELEAKFNLLNALKTEIYIFCHNKKVSNNTQNKVLKEIKKARNALKLKDCLELIGLSSSRFKRWNNTTKCKYSFNKTCVKKYPHQLGQVEIEKIKKLCTSRKYKHFPYTALDKNLNDYFNL